MPRSRCSLVWLGMAWAALAGVGQAGEVDKREQAGWGQTITGLQSRVLVEKRVFQQGEPMHATVQVRNAGAGAIRYDPRDIVHSMLSGGSLFAVTGPDGKPVPDISASAQTMQETRKYTYPSLAVGKTLSVATERLDERHYVRRPGVYRIRWRGTRLQPQDWGELMLALSGGDTDEELRKVGERAARIATGLPPSREITVEVTPAPPGGGPDGDIVGRLLGTLPKGWKVNGAELLRVDLPGYGDTFGRVSRACLAHRPEAGSLRNNVYVRVLVTEKPTGKLRKGQAYLGEGKLGHVYLAGAAAGRWNHAATDIARALSVAKPPPKPKGPDWGRMVSRILWRCGEARDGPLAVCAFLEGADLKPRGGQWARIAHNDNALHKKGTKVGFVRKNPKRPYYCVNLSVFPSPREEGQQGRMAADRSLSLGDKGTVALFKVARLGVDIRVTVLSDDAGFLKVVSGAIEGEINRVLKP